MEYQLGNKIILYILTPRYRSVLSFGPQHPSTHGVPRLIAILYGEIIQWITPEIGLLHRGTEKLIDLHYYNSSISYSDRFDHAPTTTQELLSIHALERLIGWYSNIYDSSQRSMFMEFYRIPNHCSAITTHAIDIGSEGGILVMNVTWSLYSLAIL